MKATVVSVILSVIGAIAGVVNYVPVTVQDNGQHVHGTDVQQEQDLPARCQAMATTRAQMMARMTEADAALATLVEQMNASAGQKKVDVMADLLSQLVAQRKGMHEHMMPMHEQMMQHMIEHMAASMPEDMRKSMHESMQQCPMMKGMHGQGEPGAHGEHEHGQDDHGVGSAGNGGHDHDG